MWLVARLFDKLKAGWLTTGGTSGLSRFDCARRGRGAITRVDFSMPKSFLTILRRFMVLCDPL